MAHIATKQYSYLGQVGVLIGMLGAGFLIGSLASLIPLMGKINMGDVKNLSSSEFMNSLLKPENANALRWMQFITTLFLFFLPAFFYAKICHKKAFTHLGYTKKPAMAQLAIILAIIFFSLFIIGALQEIWHRIPFSKEWLLKFKVAEEEYNKQILVMARMNGFGDYIISLLIVALLPAVFEETIFRGAIQNLLSRWTKAPLLSVIITAIIFSAVHGSYDGFMARFLLGFILGWLFYRTGNIWLNIAAHFINNAIGITVLYYHSKPGLAPDMSKIDDRFPIWLGVVGLVAVTGLLFAFDAISKKDIDRPGEEVLLPGYIDSNNPFRHDIDNTGNSQS